MSEQCRKLRTFGCKIFVLKIRRCKKWTNFMSDSCSLLLSPTHSGSLCHCHSRNIPAPSGTDRLTRSLLDSLRRCYIAPVFSALVLDNHHNHYLDSKSGPPATVLLTCQSCLVCGQRPPSRNRSSRTISTDASA